MNELAKTVLIILAIITVLFFILVGIAFYLMREADTDTLHWLAAFFVACWLFSIPTSAFMGFYFGKTESRGALRGIDATVERMFDPLVRAVEIRENVRQNIKNDYGKAGQVSMFPPDLMAQMLEQQNRQYLPNPRASRTNQMIDDNGINQNDDNNDVIKF